MDPKAQREAILDELEELLREGDIVRYLFLKGARAITLTYAQEHTQHDT